jgi:hypothetical protein
MVGARTCFLMVSFLISQLLFVCDVLQCERENEAHYSDAEEVSGLKNDIPRLALKKTRKRCV